MTACGECPANTFSTACQDCALGTFSEAATGCGCFQCEPGTYRGTVTFHCYAILINSVDSGVDLITSSGCPVRLPHLLHHFTICAHSRCVCPFANPYTPHYHDCLRACLDVLTRVPRPPVGVTRLSSPASPRIVPVDAAACQAYRDPGTRNRS